MAAALLALAKLPIVHLFNLSPLLLPFNAYLPRLRELPGICLALSGAASFVAARMRHIMASDVDLRSLTRCEQVARAFCQLLQLPWRFCYSRPTAPGEEPLDESTLQALFTVSY